MNTEKNKDIVREFFSKMNRERKSPVDLCAPGFQAQIGGDKVMDVHAFQQHQDKYFASFSENSTDFIDMLAEGDKVAYRAVVKGTHSAEYIGIPASGKQIEVVLIGVIQIRDGKVVNLWHSPDRLKWMQQIGAINL